MIRKDFEQLFSKLESPEPPAELFDKIMTRIHEEERLMSIKKRLFLFSVTTLVSAGALIPAVNAFQSDFTQSGLAQFLSLLFSDLGTIMSSWQDFGLIILESVPTVSISAFLFTILVFLWSLKRLAQAIKVVLNQPQLINR